LGFESAAWAETRTPSSSLKASARMSLVFMA
jgi:hypothetical protein